jgi:hypothetical protein
MRILMLIIAGNSEAETARAVGVTRARVNQVVKRELQGAARHRRLLADEALSIYTTRLETLMKAVWPKVLQQDLKAVEVARRLLESQARLYGIDAESRTEAPMGDQEIPDEDTPKRSDPVVEMAKYRARTRRSATEAVGDEQ